MILTYYHAVELMSSLPVLLAHVDSKKIQETSFTPAIDQEEDQTDTTGIVEMWSFTASAMEVNGADFY